MNTLRLADDRAVRARRSLRIIVVVFLWEAIAALVAAAPIHAWANHDWGSHPEGDAVFFRPGARELLAWISGSEAALSASLRVITIVALGVFILGQLPLGAMLVSLGCVDPEKNSRPTIQRSFRAAFRMFMPLVAIALVSAFAFIAILGGGAFAAASLRSLFETSLGEARAFSVAILVFAASCVVAIVPGVLADLARASTLRIVMTLETPKSALAIALRAAFEASRLPKRVFMRAIFDWAWRAALGGFFIAIGFFVSSALGGKGGVALVLLTVAHQAIVLARVGLRASWLAAALRFTQQ